MIEILAQQQGPPPGLAGVLGLIGSVWCCAIVFALAHFVILIVALVQILSRNMATDAKILWCIVVWLLPLIGPILWWTIGSKQYPPSRPGGAGRAAPPTDADP